jgi:hypothetical protein
MGGKARAEMPGMAGSWYKATRTIVACRALWSDFLRENP